MAGTLRGPIDWSLSRDQEGHRDYSVKWHVTTDDVDDGPRTVLNTPGLPAIGATWAMGNDADNWAFCWPEVKITPKYTPNEPHVDWVVEQKFSTRPLKRCQDDPIENPLDEPPKISGGFSKFTEEATQDKDGNPILNSAHERIRGALVEFDSNRPTVSISMNLASLPLASFSSMINTVNDATLWGMGPRKVKLSNVSWSRQLYGTCNFYFTVTYEFEVNDKTFDRVAADEGSKVLVGHEPGSQNTPLDPDAADPDMAGFTFKDNPKRFVVYKEVKGERTNIPLDGKGRPAIDGRAQGEITIQKYEESNLLLLGIPVSLA